MGSALRLLKETLYRLSNGLPPKSQFVAEEGKHGHFMIKEIVDPLWYTDPPAHAYVQRKGASGKPSLEQGTPMEIDECAVCGRGESHH